LITRKLTMIFYAPLPTEFVAANIYNFNNFHITSKYFLNFNYFFHYFADGAKAHDRTLRQVLFVSYIGEEVRSTVIPIIILYHVFARHKPGTILKLVEWHPHQFFKHIISLIIFNIILGIIEQLIRQPYFNWST
jgi:hypothetical protein